MINFIQHEKDGFPNGFERTLNDKIYGCSVVQPPYPVRAGFFSKRFELRSGDCGKDENWNDCETDRSRIEFISKNKMQMGDERWFAWSIYLDKSFQDVSPTKTTLGQITQHGGPIGKAGGFLSVPPLVQYEIIDEKFFLVYHDLSGDRKNVKDNAKKFYLTNLQDMKEKWTDIVLHIRFEIEQGYLESFINGESRVVIEKDFIKFEPKKFGFKYGIYNSFISRYKEKFGKNLPTQIVYFDEVRTGLTRESVDLRFNPSLEPVD